MQFHIKTSLIIAPLSESKYCLFKNTLSRS